MIAGLRRAEEIVLEQIEFWTNRREKNKNQGHIGTVSEITLRIQVLNGVLHEIRNDIVRQDRIRQGRNEKL